MGRVRFDTNGLAYYDDIPIEGFMSDDSKLPVDILFILKEPHSRDNNNPDKYQTSSWLAQKSNDNRQQHYLANMEQVLLKLTGKTDFKSCAYINIRPQFGYSSVLRGDDKSYNKAFLRAKKADKNNIHTVYGQAEIDGGEISFDMTKKAILYFMPKRIVCCGCYDNVVDILGGVVKHWNRKEPKPQHIRIENMNRVLYYVYHPSCNKTRFSKSIEYMK